MIKKVPNIETISPIDAGKVCPYCDAPTHYIDSSEVYGSSFGMIYICRPCQAWVGVHDGTDQAFGRLANAELRDWKKVAHHWFDPITKPEIIHQLYPVYVHGVNARGKAYLWLSEQLGIKKEYCHIGYFDISECQEVVKTCQPIWERFNITNEANQ